MARRPGAATEGRGSPGPPARVVVTGGAGFIGIHTVRRLAGAGHPLLVIDDLRHACGEALPDGVELAASELASPAARRALLRFRPDAVVHLAAQGGVNRSIREPVADAQANVVATVALLRACLDARVTRLVFASSGGAIYGRARQLPARETARPQPLSPYGAAKLACEGYLGTFERSFGLPSVALRFGNVYGPHQDGTGEAGLIAITCTRVLSGLAPQVRGDGLQTRDFVYVGDAVDAIVLSLGSRVTGPVNIGTGVATAVKKVVSALVRSAGWQGGVTDADAVVGEVRDISLENGLARRTLGWQPRTRLATGLDATWRSFAAQHAAAGRSR